MSNKKLLINRLIQIILIIAFVVMAIFLIKECNRECYNIPDHTNSDTIVKIDTLNFTDTIYYPKPYIVIEHVYDSIYIDTSNVIHDYFRERIYKQTFKDSNYVMDIDINIEQNKLKKFSYDLEVFQKSTTITYNVIAKEKFSLAFGGGVGWGFKTSKPSIHLGLETSFDRNIIGANYEFFDRALILDYKYKLIRYVRE